ncbi:MAG: DEAD/DEAH box helicase [Pseudomonadota bacterium]
MTDVSFADLGLSEPLLRALSAANYTHPTPIQARTIPALLQGRDVLGIAQTGTGKTAAFALPVLQMLAAQGGRPESRSPRALVLAPTRELAVQIARSFDTYGKGLGLRLGMVIGGLGFGRQIETLNRGVDILIATPGRLLDLMERGNVRLGRVGFLVLDEADRMFDMGFIRDVRRIVAAVGKERQTLLFSATMPEDVSRLAADILRSPERVEITPQGRTVDRIDQGVYFVNAANKRSLLAHLLADADLERVIVFTRTKRGANRVAEMLDRGGVPSEAIHGNKSQNARQRALDSFSRGRARVLVATDLAARGIDVQGVTHVINYELPADAESYVHRIGRTARAGASGVAISFCDGTERSQLRSIERLTNQRIAVLATPANEDLPQQASPRARDERSEEGDGRAARGERHEERGSARPGRFAHQHRGRRPQRSGERSAEADAGQAHHHTGERPQQAPRDRVPGQRSGEHRSNRHQPRGDHAGGQRFEGQRFEGQRFDGQRFDGQRADDRQPRGHQGHGRPRDDHRPGDHRANGHHQHRAHDERPRSFNRTERDYGDYRDGGGQPPRNDERPHGPPRRPHWKRRPAGGGSRGGRAA